ncbi:diaminopimelate decarboxylase, partial [bacterium]|nr:diaminopimelate decarboxylase [bacterium]
MNNRHPYETPVFEQIPVEAWNSLAPQSRQGHLNESIDGVKYRAIAEKYGTPVVILSEETLRRKYREMIAAFRAYYPDTTLSWSYKTNYLSSVCTIFRTEGAWAEVVSGFEYDIARDLGVPGNNIIFNGPHKTDAELETAFNQGANINADSFEELEQMKQLARKLGKTLEIGIRVNVRLNYPPWSKFGFSYEDGQAKEAIYSAQKDDLLKVIRFHLHGGTYITDTTIYTTAVKKIIALALEMEAETNFELRELDLGGGYASPNTLHASFLRGEAIVPTSDQYGRAVCEPLVENLPRLKRHPKLFIEPGRSIVDEGFSMVTSVVSSKHLPNGKRAIIVDAGVNVLPTAYWYKHEMVALTPGPAPEENVDVLGGLCMNIDILRTNVRLPAVKRGDLILVRDTGAYNFTQSMQFIYTRPNYVLVKNG